MFNSWALFSLDELTNIILNRDYLKLFCSIEETWKVILFKGDCISSKNMYCYWHVGMDSFSAIYISIYVHYSNVGSYIRILLLTDVSATTYMYPDFVVYISIMFLLSNLWLTWGIGLEPCKVFLAYLDFKWFLRNPKSVAQFSVEPNTCLYSHKFLIYHRISPTHSALKMEK